MAWGGSVVIRSPAPDPWGIADDAEDRREDAQEHVAHLERGEREQRVRKDQVDVIELVKVGIDVAACRAYLNVHAPSFAVAFEECVASAEAEDG